MKKEDVFPSKYLKAADLKGRTVTVTIESWEYEKFDNGKKLVLSFVGKEKKLGVNKTNFELIEEALGSDDTDDWVGRQITLYIKLVDLRGKTVEAIRCRAAGPPKPAPAPVPVPDDGDPGITDADIPF